MRSHRRVVKRHCWSLAGLTAIIVLFAFVANGCSSNQPAAQPAVGAPASESNTGETATWPPPPPSQVKATLDTEGDSKPHYRFNLGSETSSWISNRISPDGNAMILAPDWTKDSPQDGGLAYVFYSF